MIQAFDVGINAGKLKHDGCLVSHDRLTPKVGFIYNIILLWYIFNSNFIFEPHSNILYSLYSFVMCCQTHRGGIADVSLAFGSIYSKEGGGGLHKNQVFAYHPY